MDQRAGAGRRLLDHRDPARGLGPGRLGRHHAPARTPSDFGEIKTQFEGDFEGGGNETLSNWSELRLRHAYGTIGKFKAGQTWTSFMVLGAYPHTIDFFGPRA